MEATEPKTSSAIWRAIVAGRKELDVGLIKRVRDGTTISIWHDRWITGLASISPMVIPGGTILETVDQLIDTKNW